MVIHDENIGNSTSTSRPFSPFLASFWFEFGSALINSHSLWILSVASIVFFYSLILEQKWISFFCANAWWSFLALWPDWSFISHCFLFKKIFFLEDALFVNSKTKHALFSSISSLFLIDRNLHLNKKLVGIYLKCFYTLFVLLNKAHALQFILNIQIKWKKVYQWKKNQQNSFFYKKNIIFILYSCSFWNIFRNSYDDKKGKFSFFFYRINIH